MKQNKKSLYENIMTSISKEVKKILNEGRVSLQQLFQDSLSGVFQRYDNGELSSLEALRLIRAELDNNIKKMSDLQANKKIKQDLKDLDFNESLYEIVIDLDEPLKGMKSDNRYMNCYFRRVQLMNGDEVYLGYHKSNGLGVFEIDGDSYQNEDGDMALITKGILIRCNDTKKLFDRNYEYQVEFKNLKAKPEAIITIDPKLLSSKKIKFKKENCIGSAFNFKK